MGIQIDHLSKMFPCLFPGDKADAIHGEFVPPEVISIKPDYVAEIAKTVEKTEVQVQRGSEKVLVGVTDETCEEEDWDFVSPEKEKSPEPLVSVPSMEVFQCSLEKAGVSGIHLSLSQLITPFLMEEKYELDQLKLSVKGLATIYQNWVSTHTEKRDAYLNSVLKKEIQGDVKMLFQRAEFRNPNLVDKKLAIEQMMD